MRIQEITRVENNYKQNGWFKRSIRPLHYHLHVSLIVYHLIFAITQNIARELELSLAKVVHAEEAPHTHHRLPLDTI